MTLPVGTDLPDRETRAGVATAGDAFALQRDRE